MKQWWESDAVDDANAPKRTRAIAYYRHSAQDRQENSIPIQRDHSPSVTRPTGLSNPMRDVSSISRTESHPVDLIADIVPFKSRRYEAICGRSSPSARYTCQPRRALLATTQLFVAVLVPYVPIRQEPNMPYALLRPFWRFQAEIT